MSKFVSVYTSMNLPEIYLIKGLLEEEGIVCLTKDELISQMAPHITSITNGIHLLVHTDDVAQAIEIIQDAGYMKPVVSPKPSKWPTIIFIIVLIITIAVLYFMSKKNS